MNFYTLIDKKSQSFLADIIEFEDGQVVVKWVDNVISPLIIYDNLSKVIDFYVFEGRELISEGITEI